MAKTVKSEEKGASEKVRPSGAEKAAKFRDAFNKKQKSIGAEEVVSVSVPGVPRSVVFSKVEVLNNTVSVWVGKDHTASPDFVVVNPPTEVVDANNNVTEDPLTAIALIIDGATS